MRIKDYKCKCEHDDFFFADKGNQKGIYCSYCGKWLKWADKDEQNLTLKPIEALEQQPCDDCISRQAVHDVLKKHWLSGTVAHRVIDEIGLSINALPPVTPKEKEKTGHWIRVTDKAGYLVWECDKCGWQQKFNTNFCPDCGTKMVEPQESEK